MICDNWVFGENFDSASAFAVASAGDRLSNWAPPLRSMTEVSLPACAAICSESIILERRDW